MCPKTIRIRKEDDEKGYSFDLKRIRVELFHLLSIFLADEKYSQILIDENDPLWELASFGEPEVTRMLINSAVVGRVIDDREEYFLPKDNSHCGSLIRDIDNPASEGLSLREAFNKIIHATEFELVITEVDGKFSYLEPIIHLLGSHGSQKWEAELNIVEYIREYSRHVNELPKDKAFT